MTRYVLSRILKGAITLLITITLTFLILRLLPSDPALMMLGEMFTADQRQALIERIYEPLKAQSTDLLLTLWSYLDNGRSLEATARELFVHPNTVRYRLGRIAELTGTASEEYRSLADAMQKPPGTGLVY